MKSKRKSPKTHPGKCRASASIMYSNSRKMNVYMSDKVQGETKNDCRRAEGRSQQEDGSSSSEHRNIQSSSSTSALTPVIMLTRQRRAAALLKAMGARSAQEKVPPPTPGARRHQPRSHVQRWATPLNNQHSLSEGPLSITIQSASTRLRKQPWWPQVGLSSGSSDLAEISFHSRKTLVVLQEPEGLKLPDSQRDPLC